MRQKIISTIKIVTVLQFAVSGVGKDKSSGGDCGDTVDNPSTAFIPKLEENIPRSFTADTPVQPQKTLPCTLQQCSGSHSVKSIQNG